LPPQQPYTGYGDQQWGQQYGQAWGYDQQQQQPAADAVSPQWGATQPPYPAQELQGQQLGQEDGVYAAHGLTTPPSTHVSDSGAAAASGGGEGWGDRSGSTSGRKRGGWLSGGAVSVLSGATAVASNYLQNIAANVAGADEVRATWGHWGTGEGWCAPRRGSQAERELVWQARSCIYAYKLVKQEALLHICCDKRLLSLPTRCATCPVG
jgi:hypothetical protein